MSLKSYLDPVKAFDKWIKENPNGGFFVWGKHRFSVKRTMLHNSRTISFSSNSLKTN